MKWAALNFLLFANPIFAEPHNLQPPQLDWGDVVSVYTTKKFISPDGRKWNFRFHQSDAKLPEVLEGHKYRVQLVSNGIEKYDPTTTLFAAYEIWSKYGEEPWGISYHLTFYLLTPAVAQKENNN